MFTRLHMPSPSRRTRRRTRAATAHGAWVARAGAGPVEGRPVAVAGLPVGIRIAAVADFHTRVDGGFPYGPALEAAAAGADLLLIAGDLTDNGRLDEFRLVAPALARLPVPVVAVLGNHDRRGLRRADMRRILEDARVTLLDGDSVLLDVAPKGAGAGARRVRVEVVGVGGYGGGFFPDEPAGGPPLHRVTQAVAVRARREATRLERAMGDGRPDSDVRIALLHYAPTSSTLGTEPHLKYWMLGNVELGRVVDRHGVDLVVHGHAHLGNPDGWTVGGTPVRNVALPVVGGPVICDLLPADATASQVAS